MLNELSINNFAIIDELRVTFGGGLNVISGETGAGKSIIIGAVSLLLGDRATADMIRSQADTAAVEAVFDISANTALQEKVVTMGFPQEDDLIIRRVISRSGKNRAFINGQSATLANLSAVSELLINICGQHEHQVILNAENHIDILDEFGDCLDQRIAYEEQYHQFLLVKSEIERLKDLNRSREEKADLYKFQLKEILDIDPQHAEDTTLADEKKVLVNAQKLTDYAHHAYDLLYCDKDCAMVKLKEAGRQIAEIKKIDPRLNITDADLEGGIIAFEEAALTLRDYLKNVYFDENRLAAINDRLESLNRLKRKYGGTIDAVLNKKQEIEASLQTVFSLEAELEKLYQEEVQIRAGLKKEAGKLSRKRQGAATKLAEAVDREIRALNMPHASFDVAFKKADDDGPESFGPKGVDDIEFYFSANKGEESRPLNRVASGGELSRIILALKNVLSRTGSVSSVVFDEVDNGIGGAVAEIVGRKLKEVSAHHQVICITHLPQIACYGDKHMYVAKKIVKGRTVTSVEELAEDQKIEEISRMLGGVSVTRTTREHAREMMMNAQSLPVKKGERNVEKSAH